MVRLSQRFSRSPAGHPAWSARRTTRWGAARRYSLAWLGVALVGSQKGCATQSAQSAEESRWKDWHVDLALRGSHPKLADTKQLLDRRLDLPLRIDVFHVFDQPYTPLDRRTDLGLGGFYVGLGKQPSDRFVWTWYVGGGAGRDINHQRFLNTRLDVDFHYACYCTGVTGEYYPWRVPEPAAAKSLQEILSRSRPFVLAGLEAGYVSGKGEGSYLFSGVRLYHDEVKVRDWLAATEVGLGWAFPLGEHFSLNLRGGYRFYFTRPDEYDGWTWVTALRYRF